MIRSAPFVASSLRRLTLLVATVIPLAAASCALNGASLNARKSGAELETIVAERFAVGMTSFQVDNELVDMGVVFTWRPDPEGKVAVVRVLPGGFFDALPGWEERYTTGELRLYVADDRLTRAELIRRPAERYGGGEQITELSLAEAPS
jgi:hypothetical protein